LAMLFLFFFLFFSSSFKTRVALVKNQNNVLFINFIIFGSYFKFNFARFDFFKFYYLIFDFYIKFILLFYDISSFTLNILILIFDS
jgi:hypothetical protein